jgi:hypothetical protein
MDEFDPDLDAAMTGEECYKLCVKYATPEQPSYLIFNNFLQFMYPMFQGVQVNAM